MKNLFKKKADKYLNIKCKIRGLRTVEDDYSRRIHQYYSKEDEDV